MSMNDNTKSINELHEAAYNPRTMSKHDREALRKSLERFGDLSGIVFNVRTKNLVGGHQRVKAFKKAKNPKITIEHKYEPMTPAGTVARGIIEIEGFGEPFTYREVDWEIHHEESANIAANRIAGEFDIKRLAEITKDLKDFDPDLVEATGQTDAEVDSLIRSLNEEQKPKENIPNDETTLSFGLKNADVQIVDAAIVKAKGDSDIDDGEALKKIAETYLKI